MLERYGRWTVLDPNGGYRAHDKVPCRCACGTEREVPKYKLTQGRSKSCGCLKSERLRGLTPPDLAPECDREVRVGSRHGRWTALTEPYRQPAVVRRTSPVTDPRNTAGGKRRNATPGGIGWHLGFVPPLTIRGTIPETGILAHARVAPETQADHGGLLCCPARVRLGGVKPAHSAR